jgi:hypothetical protein
MTSPIFTFAVTVTLIHRVPSGQVDEYGNDIMTETSITVPNTVFVPSGSSENLAFADQVTTGEQFYMPYGTPVNILDVIQFNGELYEVQGKPSEWVSPFSGRVSPIRIDTTKITGVSA